jgi:O-6-methylguanine DNA methyltransferase
MLDFLDNKEMELVLWRLQKLTDGDMTYGDDERQVELVKQMAEYFAGTRKSFDLPLDMQGTPFQKRIWTTLQNIPYGQTISYSEEASRIGNPKAARAAASANRANLISIIIPCHRVIAKDGTLAGYGGGLPRKEYLLNLEKQHI